MFSLNQMALAPRKSPEWWDDVRGWVRHVLESHGEQLTQELRMLHCTDSCITVSAMTDEGEILLTQNLPSQRFAGPTLEACARFAPGFFAQPLAVDHPSGAFLLRRDSLLLPLTREKGSVAPARRGGRRSVVAPSLSPDVVNPAPSNANFPEKNVEDHPESIVKELLQWGAAQRKLGPHRLDLQRSGVTVMDPSWFPMFVRNQLEWHANRPADSALYMSREETGAVAQRHMQALVEISEELSQDGRPLAPDLGASFLSCRQENHPLGLFSHFPHLVLSHPFTALRRPVEALGRSGASPEDIRAAIESYLEGFEHPGQETSQDRLRLARGAARLSRLNDYAASMREATALTGEAAERASRAALDALRELTDPVRFWPEGSHALSAEDLPDTSACTPRRGVARVESEVQAEQEPQPRARRGR